MTMNRNTGSNDVPYVPKGWSDLRVGMTMTRVAALVGKSARVELNHGLTFWGYAPDHSMRSPRAVFDAMGHLEEDMTMPSILRAASPTPPVSA